MKFLKTGYAHKEDLVLEGVVYPYEQVKEAVEALKDNDRMIMKILVSYMFTTLSRAKIAEIASVDASTAKRWLDRGADLIMQRLNHANFVPSDLYTLRNLMTDEIEVRQFPKTVFRNS